MATPSEPRIRRESDDEFGIRPLAASFRDRRLEADFVEARRIDDGRAIAIALFMGGIAYAAAGVTDALVFAPNAAGVLPLVWGARALGVALCLGGAAAVYKLRSTWANRTLSALGMLGTLLTYSVIAYLEETRVGPSDFRLVPASCQWTFWSWSPTRAALVFRDHVTAGRHLEFRRSFGVSRSSRRCRL